MKKRELVILSIIYSLSLFIGISFLIKGDLSLVFNSLLLLIIPLIIGIYYILKYIVKKIEIKSNKKNNNKFFKIFDKHPFLVSIVILIICWLPYIIAYYPAILNHDAAFQIKQFLGIDNKYSYYVNLIDKNQIITNHHPVIHTLLLGSLVKLGMILGNDNIGFFFYSIIQILILSSTLSYSIKYAKDNKVSIYRRFNMLLIYSLVPVFPFYSMTAVKDVIYTCIIILYLIFIHKMINGDYKVSTCIKMVLISILLFLFRNNGIYVFFLSFIFLLLKNKNWKKVLIIFILILSLYKTYDKVILPYFKVTPTSVRETLSVPFQQTARYAKYYEKELTKEDIKTISKILDYEEIKSNYNPDLADPVKNTFNKDASKEDIKKYFKVWFKGLTKKPLVYIEATLNNTYGYFCPFKTSWYFYHKLASELKGDNIHYHYMRSTKNMRNTLKSYALIFPYIPVVGLLVNIAFNNWLILFYLFMFISKKKYRSIIYLMPAIVSILVCFASPANTYFRYAMPIIFSIPLITVLFKKDIDT